MIKNRFTLDRTLDHVRVGTLYRAVDTMQAAEGPYRTVGLWVLPAHVGREQNGLTTLARDFAHVRALVHPNIARVFNLDQDGDTYFVTAELTDGETLRTVLDHLRPERLDSRETDQVVQSLGAALAYAHDHGVVHGEVRAENVLVTMDHQFKLANFLVRTLLRSARSTPKPTDDLRDLALLAGELYTGGPLQRRGRQILLKGVPRQRAKAIEAALTGTLRDGGVREFLERAGLAVEPARAPLAGAPRLTESGARPRWRPIVPIASLALASFVLYQAAGAGWLDGLADLKTTALAALDGNTADTVAPAPTPTAVEAPAPSAPSAVDGAQATQPVEVKQSLAVPASLHREPPPEAAKNDADDAASGPAALSFTTANVTAHEGQSVITLDIARSGDDSSPATIIWWTTEGTAHARDDFASFGRRVESFAAGERVKHISIPLAADAVPEADEYFDVHLDARPTGAKLGRIANVRVTLIDDDL